MGLSVGKSKLDNAMRELMAAWQKAGEHWDDGMRADFHDQHLAPLHPRVKAAVDAMDKMATITDRARAACRDTM